MAWHLTFQKHFFMQNSSIVQFPISQQVPPHFSHPSEDLQANTLNLP